MGKAQNSEASNLSLISSGGSIVEITANDGAGIPPLEVLVGAYKNLRLQMAELRWQASVRRADNTLTNIDLIEAQIGQRIVEPLIIRMGGQAMLEVVETELQHEIEAMGHTLIPAAQIGQSQAIRRF